MPIPTVEWKRGKIKLIDQTRLPGRLVYLYCERISQVKKAIAELKVRGAPAIGITAALGVVLGIKNSRAGDFREFSRELDRTIRILGSARPTAVNLFWALERMKRTAEINRRLPVASLKKILLKEALTIVEEDKAICRRMAANGAKLLEDGDTVLTHCNAGGLATADYGTALGVIYRAREEGKKITVYADETRPLLQGARLTTWELMRYKIEVILICDNMAAEVMREEKIDKVLVGADRIAANGDCANKIGTYNLAVLARVHKIPFYVVAPLSTFDFSLKTGKDIPLEQRKKEEVTTVLGKPVAPRGVKVYNPAFDVTPHRLISAIVTERGIMRPPFTKNLRRFSR